MQSSDKTNTDQEPSKSPKIAAKDRVPKHEKALYGLGWPPVGLATQIIEVQFQQVMVFGLGMSPVMKGIIMMIFRLWDAFTDPLMGWISDNTRTRFGRRRPYMFVGGILMAALLPFVWQFNEDWDMMQIAIWFTIAGIIVLTAMTVYNIPYQTLKMEMTPDYNERTSVNVYSGVVLKIYAILIVPWIWAWTQHPMFTGQAPGEEPDSLTGIRNIAILFAGLAFVLAMIPTFICKERYFKKAAKTKKESLKKSFSLTFQNKPFLMMLGLMFALNMEGLVNGLGSYISLYYVFEGDRIGMAKFAGIQGTIGGIVGLLSVPVFGWVAQKYSKEGSLLMVTALSIAVSISVLFVFNPEHKWTIAIPSVLNSIAMAALWTIVPAMKADIVDDDEVRTGERREGSFESVFSWFLKASSTLFMGASGFIVVWLGFDIDLKADQAEGVFRKMIWALAIVPAVLGAVQFYLISRWPLTPKRMGEIREILEDRRGEIEM